MRFWQVCMAVLLCAMVPTGLAFAQNNPNDVNCSPANLLIVLDTSGSMSEGGKLDGLKKAAGEVVNQFKKNLRMGLIRFSGGQAELLVPIGPAHAKTPDVEGQAQKLLAAIQALKASGDTPMTKALDLAVQTLKKEIPSDPLHQDPDPKTQRRTFVLLVTDGEPTDATTTYNPLMFIQQLRKLQVGNKSYDVLTFVVGLGSGQQIRTFELSQYAKAGGTQNFLHALKPQDLAPYFNKISNTASKEVCDGRDNDCDGVTDEDLERECTNNCGKGKEICQKGKWSKCDAPPPGTETCNGLDDNCNGVVDEGLSRPCTTQCGKGTQSCIQGDWSTCTAPRPEPEICDGIDNDCDGQIDNGSPCPGGKCVNTGGKPVCEIKCKNGECPGGFVCDFDSGKCNERPCNRKKCAPGEECDDKTGTAICKDPCAGVTCPTGQTCGASGTCIDCYKSPCAKGKVCIQGRCTVDGCASANCPDGQACLDGKCFDVCSNVQCAAGEWCVKGRCEKDPCYNVQCQQNQTCYQGQCIDNKCTSKTAVPCIEGTICNPSSGVCEDDPCGRIKCPNGETCFRGQCGVTAPTPSGQPGTFCIKDTDCQAGLVCKNRYCIKVNTQGAPGCGCSAETTRRSLLHPVALLLLFWGFMLLLRIRRRAEQS